MRVQCLLLKNIDQMEIQDDATQFTQPSARYFTQKITSKRKSVPLLTHF